MQIRNLEDFITQMPKDLESTMEKARWLYIELGKRSFYDVSYKYLNEDEEQELMYDCICVNGLRWRQKDD